MTTIKDVARAARVSTATVSAVLNESAYVSPPLKTRVLEVVEALDYTPSGVARNLKRGKSQLIGLIVADLSNPFFANIVCAVEATVSSWGYSLVVFNSDEKPETERRIFARVRALGCDGVIISPVADTSEYVGREFRANRFPIVMLDRAVDALGCDSVTLDNVAAARDATNYLLDLGHRRIGSVTGPTHVTTGKGRMEGFVAAMKARGLEPDLAHICSGEFREEVAYSVVLSVLKSPDRPTALYVANSEMLSGVVRAANYMGLKCPEDISIVATDKLTGPGMFRSRFTRTEQPVRDMANEAIRLLMDRINRAGGEKEAPRHVVFQPTLVVRESCAPIAG